MAGHGAGSSPPPSGEGAANESVGYVVGIGSSAGGLEALLSVLGQLQVGTKAAYVIAQHLAPEHPSLIVQMLSKVTDLDVVEVRDGLQLRPGIVAIAPPKSDVTVDGDRLRLVEPAARFGPSPSVDLLFNSIAETWGARGVAVILSGTGSDGAHGMRAVRAAGGLTMVQSPEHAKFDGMPRSAIALGGSDIVADSQVLGMRLAELVSSGKSTWVSGPLPVAEPAYLDVIARQLKRVTGIDYSHYKESTLLRQIQRRMAVRQVATLVEYLQELEIAPDEVHALSRNLLVTVTSFFRDPLAFDALRERIADHVASLDPSEQLRVWVVGCATGEEVFSLAMMIGEVLGHPVDLQSRLRIFGTDLDEDGLTIARRAVYPLSVAASIPGDLFTRYAVQGETDFRIAESIRDCVVFARHNVGQDPPFPRMNLVSCRNTMIYFDRVLQAEALRLMAYGLKPGGLLFLGSSETLGPNSVGLAVLDGDHRIFQRTDEPLSPHVLPGSPPRDTSRSPAAWTGPSVGRPNRSAAAGDAALQQHTLLLEALLRGLGYAFIVLDENHDLVEVVGDVTAFCQIPQGRATNAVGSYLRPELESEARALFLLSRADQAPVTGRAITLEGGSTVRLEARPVMVAGRSLTKLSFLPEPTDAESPPREPIHDPRYDQEILRLERDLLSSQDTLLHSLADLESANEELEAASEELQASGEELQASNEELQASNEELQATNEELGTLNQELRTRGEQLDSLVDDLENIQSSLSQGMVIVDHEMRVTRYSPQAVRVFALVDTDIGRPLLGVPTTVSIPGLDAALHAVIGGDGWHSIEASQADVSYLVRVLPYVGGDGSQRGAIITLTDVSEMVALRMRAEVAAREFTQLADALEEAVWKRDRDMTQVHYASERIHELTGWTPAEIYEQPGILDDAIDPEDRERVAATRTGGASGWSIRYRLNARDGHQVWVVEVATIVDVVGDHYVVGTLADVTKARAVEEQARLLAAVRYARSLLEASLDPLVAIGADGLITDLNAATELVTGEPRELLIGSEFASHFSDPERARAGYQEVFASGAVTDYALEIRHTSGSLTPVMYNATVFRDDEGQIAGVFAAARDVTGIRRAEAALTAEARFRYAMDNSAIGMSLISPAGGIERVNPALCGMTGRSAEELTAMTMYDLAHPDEQQADLEMVQRIWDGSEDSFRRTTRILAADGSTVRVDLSVASVRSEDGQLDYLVAQLIDVTHQVIAERSLVEQATRDPLTGLANRAGLGEEITRALQSRHRSGRPTAVLMIDLDRFKNINDTLGHGAGDDLLVAAAQRITAAVRAGDLVARPGGDEFLVVMREIDEPAEAVRAAWRIVEAMREPFLVQGAELIASASVGVAIADGPRSEGSGVADDLVREADTAMYAAKAEGRDRVVVFNDDLRSAVAARMTMEGDLRQAVKNGEFEMWYQPEIELATGTIVAVEALLRWNHPSGEVYTADRFIEVAEETGLILGIGNWVLHQACAQAAIWARDRPDHPITVRINVSPAQLLEAGLLDDLDSALATSGAQTSMICLEITETALLRDTAASRANLAGIHDRGIALGLDDFGTGYASLASLRNYPFALLKIDRSFVTHLATSEADRGIVRSVVALARDLDMAVTAEGVEQSDQARTLQALGCPSAQGFLYSQAVPPEEMTALLATTFPPI